MDSSFLIKEIDRLTKQIERKQSEIKDHQEYLEFLRGQLEKKK